MVVLLRFVSLSCSLRRYSSSSLNSYSSLKASMKSIISCRNPCQRCSCDIKKFYYMFMYAYYRGSDIQFKPFFSDIYITYTYNGKRNKKNFFRKKISKNGKIIYISGFLKWIHLTPGFAQYIHVYEYLREKKNMNWWIWNLTVSSPFSVS